MEEEGGIQMCPCLPINSVGRHDAYSFAVAEEPHRCPSALTSQKGTVFLRFIRNCLIPNAKCLANPKGISQVFRQILFTLMII